MRKCVSGPTILKIATAALLLAGPGANAANLTWDGSIGNWDTDVNWLVDSVEPTINDKARIDGGQVTVNQTGEAALTLTVGDDFPGTLIVEEGGALRSFGLTVGKTRDSVGELSIKSGGKLSSGSVDLGEYGYGTASVSGSRSAWTASTLNIGTSGRGELAIEDGGFVSSTTSYLGYEERARGTVTVTGAGSAWTSSSSMYVGRFGTGILNIDAGGSASNTFGYIGYIRGHGTVNVTGAGSTWTNLGSLAVGSSSTGVLNIEDGGAVSNTDGYVGSGNSNGAVTVTGADSAWNSTGDLHIGVGVQGISSFNESIGTLTIVAGGTVSSTTGYVGYDHNSYGTVSVTGSGSAWTNTGNIFIGFAGTRFEESTGTLIIEAGGVVSNTTGYIGHSSFSNATATVSGAGSKWTNTGDLYINRFGNGTLNIEAGGTVTNTNGYLGYTSKTARVNVIGAGSAWINTGDLTIGNVPTDSRFVAYGTLNIEAGGIVISMDSYLGGDAYYSNGTVKVAGSGSSWVSASGLYVGHEGSGTLTIEVGGAVSSMDGFVAYSSDARGRVTVSGSGSSWANASGLYVGHEGSGTLMIEDGGTVSSTGGFVGYSSDAGGTVTVSGSGSSWVNAGSLFVAREGRGNLNIAGGRISIAGDLIMQSNDGTAALNPTLTSLTDPLIDVVGNATLAGTLSVSLAPGFTIAEGDAFTLIDIGGTQSGLFDNVAQDERLGTFKGFDLILTYTGGDGNDVVAYTVISSFDAADLDFDGDVDDADYGLMFAGFTGPNNGPTSSPNADLDNDGDVDDADFGIALAAFTGPGGFGQLTASAPASVPEPASAALLALGGAMLARRRRKFVLIHFSY